MRLETSSPAMEFWGVEVKPKQTFRLARSDYGGSRLHISQATLGRKPLKGQRVIVKCRAGDGSSPSPSLYLCSFLPGISESCSLDLYFEDDIAISVKGSTSVHLVGYFEGSYEDDEPGEDVEDDGYSDEEGHDEEDEDDDSMDDFICDDEEEEEDDDDNEDEYEDDDDHSDVEDTTDEDELIPLPKSRVKLKTKDVEVSKERKPKIIPIVPSKDENSDAGKESKKEVANGGISSDGVSNSIASKESKPTIIPIVPSKAENSDAGKESKKDIGNGGISSDVVTNSIVSSERDDKNDASVSKKRKVEAQDAQSTKKRLSERQPSPEPTKATENGQDTSVDKTNATSESAKKKKKHKKKKESEQKEGPLDPQSTQNDNGTPLNEGKDKTPSKQHKVKKHSETENVAVGEPNGKQEKSRKKVK